MKRRVLIVGGVAGGMSCATRLKRLDDSLEVVIFEKGDEVSFANCGMPYYIGGIIKERKALLVQTSQGLRNRFGLDVRTKHEVISIDRSTQQITVKNLTSGDVSQEKYDLLVLSPGATPFQPNIPGIKGNNVFTLSSLSDMDAITDAVKDAHSVLVVGAGFIGLELVENFKERHLQVHLVELMDQVLPPLDREMTCSLEQELRLHGVNVILNDEVISIDNKLVKLKSGQAIESDFICLCIGVRPNSSLAKEAGLLIGERGHIQVDESMRTSDSNIYAVGDAVEVKDFVTGLPMGVPLAGPANRQGRIVADAICGRLSSHRSVQGTAIVRVFNLAAACTGLNEKRLKQLGIKYRRAYIFPTQHPRYYPEAKILNVKILFGDKGELFGAQVIGAEGANALIDVLATAMYANLNVADLEHLELAYSPQWGNAKHGINMIGFVASNILRGDLEVIEADNYPSEIQWLDVRTPAEAEHQMLPHAILMPIDSLRERYGELSKDKTYGTYCAVGLRGYNAYRFLKQHGFKVFNLNGGHKVWSWYHSTGL